MDCASFVLDAQQRSTTLKDAGNHSLTKSKALIAPSFTKFSNYGLVAFILVALHSRLCTLSGVAAAMMAGDPPHGPAIYNTEYWVEVRRSDPASSEGNAGTSHTKPLPPISPSWLDPTAHIFVGIVSYRDKRCSATLDSLFSNAKYPERVHVGIVEQYHTEEDKFNCKRDYCQLSRQRNHIKKGKSSAAAAAGCAYENQISTTLLTHQDGRGPNYARYMQQAMINHEEFCMQVDAHTQFVPDWDVVATQTWAAAENEYAVISTAPPDVAAAEHVSSSYSSLSDSNAPQQQVPHVCQATIDKRGAVVNLPPTRAAHLKRPLLAPLWSAGFSFSKCHAELKVPNDPNLQMIYDADEFSKYARLWTRGYDVYTPHTVIALHDYRNKMPGASGQQDSISMEWAQKNAKDIRRSLYDRSVQRIATLLGFPESPITSSSASSSALIANGHGGAGIMGNGLNEGSAVAYLAQLTKYGLGVKRSLDQFIEFTGVDTRKRVIFGDRCSQLQWVPFEADTDPWVDTSDAWGGAPETLLQGGTTIPIIAAHGDGGGDGNSGGGGGDGATVAEVLVYPITAYENAYADALSARQRSTISGGTAAAGNNGRSRGRGSDLGNSNHERYSNLAHDVVRQIKGAEHAIQGAELAAEELLRTGAHSAAQRAETVMEGIQSMHRGKELWWLFQPVDSAIEAVMNRIDTEMGPGQGAKVVRALLVLAPFLYLVVSLAIWILTSGSKGRIFDHNLKKI